MTEEIVHNEQPTKKLNWAKTGLLLSALGVLILFIGFYFAWIKINAQTDTSKKELQQVNAHFNELSQRIDSLNNTLSKQAQTLTELHQLQATHPSTWRLAEAQYLVKLANDQLQFMQNLPIATKLLEAANSEIANLTDPNLEGLHKALAQDIARLQSIPPVNVDQIYLQLIAVDEKLNQLALPLQPGNSMSTPGKVQEDLSQLPWWKRGLHQTWNSLQKIIVVHHNAQQPIFVTPEQRQAIYLNLHAKLEAAIWGLLHHQNAIYQKSLAELTQWISQYFIQDAPLTKTVLTNLTELQKISVQLPTDSVIESLQAFQTYFQSQPVTG